KRLNYPDAPRQANVPMLDQASSHFWSRGFRSAFRIPSQHLPHSKLLSGLLKRVDWALCCYKITSHGLAFSLCSSVGGSPYLRPKANQTSESGYSMSATSSFRPLLTSS